MHEDNPGFVCVESSLFAFRDRAEICFSAFRIYLVSKRGEFGLNKHCFTKRDVLVASPFGFVSFV